MLCQFGFEPFTITNQRNRNTEFPASHNSALHFNDRGVITTHGINRNSHLYRY